MRSQSARHGTTGDPEGDAHIREPKCQKLPEELLERVRPRQRYKAEPRPYDHPI